MPYFNEGSNGGAGGSVTSVGLSLPAIFTVSGSPVTTSGTLTAVLASQNQNLVLASPSGSSGAPTMRALVNADFPASGATAASYGDSTHSATIAVNAQGIVTSASTSAVLLATDSAVVHLAGSETITGLKTFGAGVLASGAVANDWSGGSGAFLTSTGAVTIGPGAVSLSGAVTLAANVGVAGTAGTGALSLGSLTGDATFPTGQHNWTGASGKAASFVSNAAAITITAGAASTWSCSSGGLTVSTGGNASVTIKSGTTDGGTAVGNIYDTTNAAATNGNKIHSFRSGGTEWAYFGISSQRRFSFTGDSDSSPSGPLVVTSQTSGATGAGITMDATLSTSGRQFSIISTGTGASPGAGFLAFVDNTAPAYRILMDSSGNLRPSSGNAINLGSVSAAGWKQCVAFQFCGAQSTQTTSGAVTIDPTAGETAHILSNGNVTSLTITLPGASINGQLLRVFLKQNSGGTNTWPTTITNARLIGGTFTKTATANATDALLFNFNSVSSKWDQVAPIAANLS